MIRTIRPLDKPDPGLERVAKASGFSLHAGVSCEGHQNNKRERLCRYIARPAVAIPRISKSSTGKVVYTLKTPYRESLPHERSECFGYGTTQVAFQPLIFIARLATLVPKPRVNLIRYHGVLAPNHRWRGLVTPGRRGRGVKSISNPASASHSHSIINEPLFLSIFIKLSSSADANTMQNTMFKNFLKIVISPLGSL